MLHLSLSWQRVAGDRLKQNGGMINIGRRVIGYRVIVHNKGCLVNPI
jgi:lipoate-protein ligase A